MTYAGRFQPPAPVAQEETPHLPDLQAREDASLKPYSPWETPTYNDTRVGGPEHGRGKWSKLKVGSPEFNDRMTRLVKRVGLTPAKWKVASGAAKMRLIAGLAKLALSRRGGPVRLSRAEIARLGSLAGHTDWQIAVSSLT